MPPSPPSKGGRPRGSGRPARLVKIDLAPKERVPWAAGYRIVMKDPDLARTYNGFLPDLLGKLTGKEREALNDMNAAVFDKWLTIGMQCGLLEMQVRLMREE